jgi:hypothetical protein
MTEYTIGVVAILVGLFLWRPSSSTARRQRIDRRIARRS